MLALEDVVYCSNQLLLKSRYNSTACSGSCVEAFNLQRLGKGLKKLPRDQIVLATKFGRYGPDLFDFSAERVRGVHHSQHRIPYETHISFFHLVCLRYALPEQDHMKALIFPKFHCGKHIHVKASHCARHTLQKGMSSWILCLVAEGLKESMERLQVDYVDIFQCHDIEFRNLDQVRLLDAYCSCWKSASSLKTACLSAVLPL